MNPYQFSRNLLALACTCLVLAACQTTQSGASNAQSSQSEGQLVVHRAANLGGALILSIDGGKQTDLRVGDTYNGSLAPGRHIVSIIPAPNEQNQAASSVTLMVVKGQTYSFTAAWQGGQVALVKD